MLGGMPERETGLARLLAEGEVDGGTEGHEEASANSHAPASCLRPLAETTIGSGSRRRSALRAKECEGCRTWEDVRRDICPPCCLEMGSERHRQAARARRTEDWRSH